MRSFLSWPHSNEYFIRLSLGDGDDPTAVSKAIFPHPGLYNLSSLITEQLQVKFVEPNKYQLSDEAHMVLAKSVS